MRKNVLAVLVIILLATLGLAAQQGGGALRTVSGRVVNGRDQPLHKAVVHLKNTRTLAIKTYITEPDGAYRFTALSPNVDYELYAEYEGAHSDNKTVSAFSSRKQVTINLKIKSAR